MIVSALRQSPVIRTSCAPVNGRLEINNTKLMVIVQKRRGVKGLACLIIISMAIVPMVVCCEYTSRGVRTGLCDVVCVGTWGPSPRHRTPADPLPNHQPREPITHRFHHFPIAGVDLYQRRARLSPHWRLLCDCHTTQEAMWWEDNW